MPLTPEDVANKQFTSTRLKPGYDETEVDEFLDEVEAELTRLYRENDELKSKLAAAQRSAAESGDGGRVTTTQQIAPPPAPTPAAPPPTPAPTPPPPPAPTPAQPPAQAAAAPTGASTESATGILAMAQRTADEFIAEAQTQADRIVGEARQRGELMRREGEEKQRQLIGSLESERQALERKVEGLRAFEREYRSRLKSYLETQLRELEGRNSEAPAAQSSGGGGPQGQQGEPSGQSVGQPAGQQRGPFAPGAPVGSGNSGPPAEAPGGPPQQPQASQGSGYVLDEGPEPRG